MIELLADGWETSGKFQMQGGSLRIDAEMFFMPIDEI